MSPIGAGTTLGICAIPVMALYVQLTCMLWYRVQCHVLCYALQSHHDPYTLSPVCRAHAPFGGHIGHLQSHAGQCICFAKGQGTGH